MRPRIRYGPGREQTISRNKEIPSVGIQEDISFSNHKHLVNPDPVTVEKGFPSPLSGDAEKSVILM